MNTRKMLHRLPTSALVCAGLLFNVSSVMAGPEPAQGESAAQSNSDEYQPLGLRAGTFKINPLIELTGEYDDNIFKVPERLERDDYMLHVKPAITVQSDWNRHALNGSASADLTYHNDYTSEDYNDWDVAADGRLDTVRDSYATWKAGYSYLHEDRTSVDDRFGIEPTLYDFAFLGLGYDHTFNRMGFVASYDYEMLDYDDVPSIFGGIIDNDDRDRNRQEGKLRVGYEMRPQFDLYVEGSVNKVDYDQDLDRSGRNRSSTGYRVVGGLSMDVTSVLVGDIYAGYLNQDYDDPSFLGIDDTAYGFGLTWFTTDLTTVTGNLDRIPEETTEPNASGYLSTIFSANIDHELKRNILLFGSALYINNDYEQSLPGAKENENTLGFGAGAKYLFNRRFYTTAEYNYERRNSDIELQEYTDNAFMLTVGAQW